ncbi:MAG TPA: 6,7-dimethyl-8-ribityllumazine synthase [Gaiellaceae bacterium]|jgi:6,7-dimethyl-8-ribityllumazine synthase
MSDQHGEFPERGASSFTNDPAAPSSAPDATIAAPPVVTADEAAEPGGSSVASEAVATEAPSTETIPSTEPVVEEPEDADEAREADEFPDWPEIGDDEVEDAPADGESIQHVAGEVDVPDGYAVLEGTPTGHRRSVAIVVARFNGGLTSRMLANATDALEDAGVAKEAVTVMLVPGAFELPLAAMALAKTRRFGCVVALGAIVRGETPHFDYIAAEAASGLQLAAIETGVPCAFGVLTVETVEQAEARIDRAGEAVRTALEMADVFAQLRASARA